MAQLRKRGLVTAVIYSGPFRKLGETQARIFGVPELPLIEIPHPLGGISIDEVRARADVASPAFIELIKANLK
ncbi:MAG: hypothetical protein ACK5TE_10100 [Pseudomonadota bacterium]|jgi:hypothetical protein